MFVLKERERKQARKTSSKGGFHQPDFSTPCSSSKHKHLGGITAEQIPKEARKSITEVEERPWCRSGPQHGAHFGSTATWVDSNSNHQIPLRQPPYGSAEQHASWNRNPPTHRTYTHLDMGNKEESEVPFLATLAPTGMPVDAPRSHRKAQYFVAPPSRDLSCSFRNDYWRLVRLRLQ